MTICLFAMAALAAHSRRVARINQLDLDTCPRSFIADKCAKLGESPGVPFIAVSSTNSYPLSDPCQILKSQCLASTNGFVYQGFANDVVRVCLKTFLAPAHLFEAAFCRTCSHLLQNASSRVKVFTHCFDLSATKRFACAIRGHLNDAKIDPKCLICFSQFRCILTLSDIQVVGARSPYQISPADFPGLVNQHLVLSFAQKHLADHAPLQCIEGDPVKAHKAIGACIVTDGATRPELWAGLPLFFLRCFQRFDSFSTSAHGQLRPKPKASTGFSIDAVMGRIGIRNMLIPTNRGDPRSSFVKTLLRLLQSLFMFIYVKLDANCSYEHFLHTKSVPYQRKKSREEYGKGGVRLRARGHSSPA